MRNSSLEIVVIAVIASWLVCAGSSHAVSSEPEDDPARREGTWVGAHVDDVIAKWGNPSEKRRDGRGGWTLAYVGSGAGVTTPQVGVGPPTRTPPQTRTTPRRT